MQRLSELPAEDRLSWRAQALIRAMGATVESEDRLLRVRRLLDKPPPRGAALALARCSRVRAAPGSGTCASPSGRPWF